MYDEITAKQKIAEESVLDEKSLEVYLALVEGYSLLTYLFLKKRETRKEITEVVGEMHKISKKYLKYDARLELYKPETAMGYGYVEWDTDEDTRYKDPNAAPKLQIMKDFLMMAKSGKYKNRTAVYAKIAKKYKRSQPLITGYCKNLRFDRGESL